MQKPVCMSEVSVHLLKNRFSLSIQMYTPLKNRSAETRKILQANGVLTGCLFLCLSALVPLAAQPFAASEIARWEKQARAVTIVRDQWGIPHIYGKTDADAVFGLLYAQCEDDFRRVEMNYIEKLGRMAEVNGIADLYEDLLIRLVIDSAAAQKDYKKAPRWLKKLLQAQADGINYYLHTHPQDKPRLLHRFHPWYPLLWTDGSISAINTDDVTTEEIRQFYTGDHSVLGSVFPKKQDADKALTGSNGFAFAPKITESGNAILYINPHVTFYFRPEVHVVSEEGLNVYGAVTWGQFFVYQGFNEYCGWMHTSNYTDIADLYAEKIVRKKGRLYYRYEGKDRRVQSKKIDLRYRVNGRLASKTIETFHTRHGPVMTQRQGQWLSLKANNRSITGLIQSWQRTKARGLEDYKKTMALRANTSNNTVYADRAGNIAYWHGNFMPRRDLRFDWSQPVDGSIAATEWQGLHRLEETVQIYNPPGGWLQNCNATPFTVAGHIGSPSPKIYPPYMAPDGENFRGLNAVRVLSKPQKYNLDKVIAAGYDTYMVAFELLIPALMEAAQRHARQSDTLTALLAEPLALLKNWDYRAAVGSVATTLAVEWGDRLLPDIARIPLPGYENLDQVHKVQQFLVQARAEAPERLLLPLAATVRDLEQRFGKWQVPWGEVNRFQRVSADLVQPFSDASPSLPVAFTSAAWGMLPSYKSNYFPGTRRRYGVNGNSFVCAVEFGPRLRAKSLLAGGQNGHPASPHFFDQGAMYAGGQFKEVLFYREDVDKNARVRYHPGQPTTGKN